MRDEKRIKRITDKLRTAWETAPDQRFGQLLINMGLVVDDFGVWNAECYKFEEAIDKWIKEYTYDE